MSKDSFESYWKSIRKGIQPSPVRDSVDVVSIQFLHAWLQDADNPRRPSFFVVSGGNRAEFYQRFQEASWLFDRPGSAQVLLDRNRNWLQVGIAPYLLRVMKELDIPPEFRERDTSLLPMPRRGQPWEILWGLLSCSYLSTGDDAFQEVINRGSKPVLNVIRILSTFRAFLTEVRDPQRVRFLVDTWGKWLEGTPLWSLPFEERELLREVCGASLSHEDQLTTFLSLLSLAKHNNVLGTLGLSFDGVEEITLADQAEDLYKLLLACDEWVYLGSPLCPILGWRDAKEDRKALRKMHRKLASRLSQRSDEVRESSEPELV